MTAKMIKEFKVEYRIKEESHLEVNVKLDRLRLKASNDGIPTHIDGSPIIAVSAYMVRPLPVIDQITGS